MSNRAKKFLQQFETARDELESLAEEHERLVSSIMSITASYDSDGCGGSASDKIGDDIARLVDLRDSIEREVGYYSAVRDHVRRVVREVKLINVTMGQSLHYRYIDCDKPAIVAYRMGYDERQERRIHQAALCVAEHVMDGMGMTDEWLKANIYSLNMSANVRSKCAIL